MGLKADRFEQTTDISYYMNHTATRGRIVCHDTSGSGAAMDQALAVVATPTGGVTPTASVSGKKPAGLLLNDVVNNDLTRVHQNWHKDETNLGGKVTLLRNGWVVTDLIVAGQTPTAGQSAYFDANGYLTPTNPDTGSGTWPKSVGTFGSAKDADGYAKVFINITG